MPYIYIDTETFSRTPIKNGTYRYTADCELLLITYAVDDGEVHVVDYDGALPLDFSSMLHDPAYTIVAHNSTFDRNVLKYAVGADIPVERWVDTAVQALAHSLPQSLAPLCDVFKLSSDVAKHKDGKRLIKIFCCPDKNGNRTYAKDKPEDWKRFVEYAINDIKAMREIHKRMPTWNNTQDEKDLWCLDQRINDRGVLVDTGLATAAIAAVESRKSDLRDDIAEQTRGVVASATQRNVLLAYIMENFGIHLDTLTKSDIAGYLDDDDIPEGVKELLRNRLEAGNASTAKYPALLRAVSDDNRLRGTLQFCGAARTGRWSGRIFQPQNLPRPTFKNAEINAGIAAFKAGLIDLTGYDVTAMASSAIRGCLIASPNTKLVIADLANIEGRDQAWLAGEEWKLQAFRDYDTIIGTDARGKPIRRGHDLYKLAYAKSFNTPPEEVDDTQRSIGKVQELALGYAGGAGAFATFAAGYGVDLDAMADKAYPSLPQETREKAENFYTWMTEQKRSTYSLRHKTFVVCDAFKRLWRDAHPNVVSFWRELEDAARMSINAPGVSHQCRSVWMIRQGSWLRVVLPSGRSLCYPGVKLDDEGAITYMGSNQLTRKWERVKTFGGKLFENICQAVARDILADTMRNVENAGYKIVLTVHDEVIAEAPDSKEYSHQALSAFMSTPPSWALDIPLAAAGFEAYRYAKH